MDDLTTFLITFSTAEDEANLLLDDETPRAEQLSWQQELPEGQYRVINGRIFRVAGGVPLLP